MKSSPKTPHRPKPAKTKTVEYPNGLTPSLYSLNSNGSIQQWTITVHGNIITKVYGQVGGKFQTTSETILDGKHIGKVNETSAGEQALIEAYAQWEKKLKSGYVKNITDAKTGKVDKLIAGGIEPMLAQKFRDHAHKIVYPAYCQPKLDGIRCIAIVKNGKCTLWSRTRKLITGVPHIARAVELALGDNKENLILDGELYNHTYKDKFEQIVSFVRQETPKAGHEVVQYHIYDIACDDLPFNYRSKTIEGLCFKAPLVTVETRKVANESELMEYFTHDRVKGYEGLMVRNADSMYEYRRSFGLQKIKEFDDAEFEIVGLDAGRGRMEECAIFECVTKNGDNFNCKMEGALETLKPYLKDPSLAIGRLLTVRFQGYTTANNIPRFPVGVIIRDYE